MNSSRIEESIEEIFAYVENCKSSKLYQSKVTVDRDELYGLLDALKNCVPDEISSYQKVVNNRDNIINDAQQRAERMLTEAQAESARLLDESELIQTAYSQAEQIVNQATAEAQNMITNAENEVESMRKAALMYTNDLLTQAQKSIENSLQEIENKQLMFTSALKNGIEIIKGNKDELMSQLEPNKVESADSAPENKGVELEPVNQKEEKASLDDVLEDATGHSPKPIKVAAEEFEVPEEAFVQKAEQ